MASVESAEKNSDTVPRIEGHYSVYMYDSKLGICVPSHFDLPGNTKLFSAWKLWLSGNPDYICTNTGREMITAPIHPLMNSTVGSIR